jgi:hypothetical protein
MSIINATKPAQGFFHPKMEVAAAVAAKPQPHPHPQSSTILPPHLAPGGDKKHTSGHAGLLTAPRKALMGQATIGWRHLNIKRLRSLYASLQSQSDESLEQNADELIAHLRQRVGVNGDAFSDGAFDQKHQDPALQYILVREALERIAMAQAPTDPQQNKEIEATLYVKAKKMFEQQSLPVLSGLNTAEAIAATVAESPGMLEKSILRTLYRSQLIDAPGPGSFVVQLLKLHTPQDLLKVLQGLMNAASDDLNSAVSSSTLKVVQCLENLRICKLIQQVYTDFEKALFRIAVRHIYDVANTAQPDTNDLLPKDFSVAASHYSTVFSKPWQEVATDFLKMLCNVPTRSQLEDKVNRAHLHPQLLPKHQVRLRAMYSQCLKTMFERLPEEAFLRHVSSEFSHLRPTSIPQERLDRLTWIDFSADLYGGREVDTSKNLRC